MTAGIPTRAHGDIVGKARDLIAAQRATRDILLDRAEPPAPRLVAPRRKLFDLFRKKRDPFAVTPQTFDRWAAEIAAYHPARRDLWRETVGPVTGGEAPLDLPGVAMAAEKWESS